MIAVAFREDHQAAAIEIDAASVRIIGILPGSNSAGVEPDATLRLVDMRHRLHNPFAARDLIFDRASFGINQIKMIPAITLTHPQNFSLADPVDEKFAGITDEGRTVFVNDRARRST